MHAEMAEFDNDFLTGFLMISDGYILLELSKSLDIVALLSLVCSHQLYEEIHKFLFQIKTKDALLYQEKWIRKSLLEQNHPHQLTPLKSLKQLSLNDKKISQWLARKDITNEMRFYGLLYNTRLAQFLPHLNQETFLANALDHIEEKSYFVPLQIILPYLAPSITQKTKDRFYQFIEDRLTKLEVSLKNTRIILNLSVKYKLLIPEKVIQLYETEVEKWINLNIDQSIKIMSVFISCLNHLLPQLQSEHIERLLIQTIGLLKHTQQRGDAAEFDKRARFCDLAWLVLTSITPYLQTKQIRELLSLCELYDWGGSIHEVGRTLEASIPRLQPEQIEEIIEKLLRIVQNQTLPKQTRERANERINLFCLRLPAKLLDNILTVTINEIQVGSEAVSPLKYQRLVLLLPRLSDIQIFDVFSSLIQLFRNENWLRTIQYEPARQINELLLVILSRLKTEQIKEMLAFAAKLMQAEDLSIRSNAYRFSTFLLFFPQIQTKEIIISALDSFQKNKNIIFEIKKKKLKVVLSRLGSEALQEVYGCMLAGFSVDKLKTVFHLSSYLLPAFLPNLQPGQIAELLPHILALVEDEELYSSTIGFRQEGWKALAKISTYLPVEKINEILALTFVAHDEDKNIFPHACAVIETLLPRLQPEQIQALFAHFIDIVPKFELTSFYQAGCQTLIQIIPYLSPNHIRAYFLPTLRLLQRKEASLCLAAYKLMNLLAPEMKVEEIDVILPEIKTLFQKHAQSAKREEISDTEDKIIATVYHILQDFLPKLNEAQLFDVIPPLSLALWDNRVDHDKSIALANLIKDVLPRINFSSVQDSLFIDRPELMLVNLMHQYWQKNPYNKPISGLIYSTNLSLFSGGFGTNPADIKPTEGAFPDSGLYSS